MDCDSGAAGSRTYIGVGSASSSSPSSSSSSSSSAGLGSESDTSVVLVSASGARQFPRSVAGDHVGAEVDGPEKPLDPVRRTGVQCPDIQQHPAAVQDLCEIREAILEHVLHCTQPDVDVAGI